MQRLGSREVYKDSGLVGGIEVCSARDAWIGAQGKQLRWLALFDVTWLDSRIQPTRKSLSHAGFNSLLPVLADGRGGSSGGVEKGVRSS